MMGEKHQCEARVPNASGMRYRQCQRIGKYEHDGKHYCKQHHPPFIKEKDDERDRKDEIKWEIRGVSRQIQDAKTQIINAVCAEPTDRFWDAVQKIREAENRIKELERDMERGSG